MRSAQYFRFCLQQPIEWLKACVASPSPFMRRRHIAIARLAIRQMEGK